MVKGIYAFDENSTQATVYQTLQTNLLYIRDSPNLKSKEQKTRTPQNTPKTKGESIWFF